jgi:hypothetical protein
MIILQIINRDPKVIAARFFFKWNFIKKVTQVHIHVQYVHISFNLNVFNLWSTLKNLRKIQVSFVHFYIAQNVMY